MLGLPLTSKAKEVRIAMIKRLIHTLIFSLAFSLIAQSAFANDLLIWDQLQGKDPKGYVLLFRHSLAPGVGDPANFKLNDCSTQRNLSAEGRKDAKEIGQWLQRRQVKIARVESSRWCRAKETAQLLNLGKVVLNRNLDSLFQEEDATKHPQTSRVRQQIINHRNKAGLLVLVGHYVNIAALTGVGVDSGEGVLVRADSKGVIKVFGATPDLNS
jgi:phosphohistidine phosphatase SixA